MNEIAQFLPFVIPVVIVEIINLGYTLHHIFTHSHYRRGSRALWVLVSIVGMNFVGPVLYFLLGKEDH